MMLPGDITADFNSHPTAPVVIDSVHSAVRVVQCKGVTDHRVPTFVEVAPPFTPRGKPDQYRPHCATRFGMRAIFPWDHDRNAIKMVHDHLVGQDFSAKQ